LSFLDPMEALEHMRREKPDLIITDLMMKAIDSGLSFSRLINHDPRFQGIPIILVTSASKKRGFQVQIQGEKSLERMGINAYFDKPVDPSKLLAKMRELLSLPKE